MRHLATALLAASLMTAAAHAQYRDPYGRPEGPPYGRRGPDSDVVRRVMSHLDRVSGPGWDHGDRKRIEHAREDLFRFQDKLSRGRFDRGRLDSAINNLDHVTRSYRMNPRERDLLQHDVYELREFRARGGSWDRDRRW